MVHLDKVNVQHHSSQGDEYRTGQNSCVLCKEEDGVSDQPYAAGVHDDIPDGHFGGADRELLAEAGVILTVQGNTFTLYIREGFVLHRSRVRYDEKGIKQMGEYRAKPQINSQP